MKSHPFPDEDNITRIETIEGSSIYVISRLKSHPANLKTYFQFGELTIYEEGKKGPLIYKGELISLECLNQGMEWTMDYFKRIRNALSTYEKKEVAYSFKQSDEEGSLVRIFRIIFKIARGAELIALNVKCLTVTTNKISESILEEMIKINTSKNKTISDMQKRIDTLENEKTIVLDHLNQISKAKQDLEHELIDKFTLLLNEKKKKIIEMQQIIENAGIPYVGTKTSGFDNLQNDMQSIESKKKNDKQTLGQTQGTILFNTQYDINDQNTEDMTKATDFTDPDSKKKTNLQTQASLDEFLARKF